jgi:hypothetical protein
MNPNRCLAVAAAFAALTFGATLAVSPSLAGAHDGEHPDPGATPAPVTSGELTGAQRQVIREATRALRDPAAAEAAGYLPSEACAELPGVGGMGQHWVNPALLLDGGRIDPTMPEVLLFAPGRGGRLELLGVEYLAFDADGDLTTDDDRPTMLGHPLDGPMPGHEEDMPVHYDLHAWVFTHNPSGELAPWNPRVSCDVER